MAVEGPRTPPASAAARGVTALVVVVDAPRAAFGSADCRELSEMLAARFSDFQSATLGRLRLEQLLAGQGDCDAAEWTVPAAADAPRPESSCSVQKLVAPKSAMTSAENAGWKACGGVGILAVNRCCRWPSSSSSR